MKIKKFSVIGVAVASMLSAASIAPPAAQASGSFVTMWVASDVAGAYATWAQGYNRTHPSGRVNVVAKPGFSGKDLLQTVSDSDAPDLITSNHDGVGVLKAQGFIVPLTLPNASQFSAADKTAFQLKKINYGIPLNIQNTAFFTNLNLVKRVPKTMAELEADSKAFLKKHPKAKFTVAVPPEAYHMYPYFSGLGGYIFGGQSGNWNVGDVGIANKKFLKNAPLIDKWYSEKIFNPNVSGDYALGSFTNNQAPYAITGPWNINKIRFKHMNYEISSIPALNLGFKTVPFVTAVGVCLTKWANPAKHNVQLKANAILADLASPKTQLLLSNAIAASPANLVAKTKFKDVDARAFAAAGKGGVYMPNNLEMAGVWTPLTSAWNQVKSNKYAVNRFKTASATIKAMIN